MQAPPTPPIVPDVAPIDRVRAMCMLLGVSNNKEKDLKPGAVAAAKASVRTGEIFLESAYANGIDSYFRG